MLSMLKSIGYYLFLVYLFAIFCIVVLVAIASVKIYMEGAEVTGPMKHIDYWRQ